MTCGNIFLQVTLVVAEAWIVVNVIYFRDQTCNKI